MNDLTRRLARASASHPGRTLGVWGPRSSHRCRHRVLLGSALTTEGEMTNDPESYRGYALIREHFPPNPEDMVNEVVIVRSATVSAEEPAFKRHVTALAAHLEDTGLVLAARTFYGTGERALVSPDGHAALITVALAPSGEDRIGEIVDTVDAAESEGFETAITGEFTADEDYQRLSEEDLQKGEFQFGIPAALVVLLLVFGSIVAGLVPVLTALVAIVVALALTALVGQAFDLSVFVVNMLTGMGLALGIDYALFIVSRYREERNRGRPELDAITVSGATASRAVLFSGTAFVLAMVGMVLVPDTILRSLATGAILVGIVSVVAALTLLPAILGLLGDRVNALRIPWLGRRIEKSAGTEGRTWSRIVRRCDARAARSAPPRRSPCFSRSPCRSSTSRPASPASGRFPTGSRPSRGSSRSRSRSESEPSTTCRWWSRVTSARRSSVPRSTGIAAEIGANPAFRNPQVDVADDGQAAVVEALVAGDSRDARALAAVEDLRDDTVPDALGTSDASRAGHGRDGGDRSTTGS